MEKLLGAEELLLFLLLEQIHQLVLSADWSPAGALPDLHDNYAPSRASSRRLEVRHRPGAAATPDQHRESQISCRAFAVCRSD